MARYLKLEKKTISGTLLKQFALMCSVVLQRSRTSVNQKTGLVSKSERLNTSHTFCSSIAAAKAEIRAARRAGAEGRFS